MLVILRTTKFQLVRGIEYRGAESMIVHQRQRNEQATKASVAIKEGVDCLELIVHKRGFDDWIDISHFIDDLSRSRRASFMSSTFGGMYVALFSIAPPGSIQRIECS